MVFFSLKISKNLICASMFFYHGPALLGSQMTPTGEASEVIQEFSKVPFAEPTYLGDVEKVYITSMYV